MKGNRGLVSQIIKSVVAFLVLSTLSLAWGQDDIKRGNAESELPYVKERLARIGSEITESQRSIIESYAAMLEAMQRGDDAEQFRLEDQLYLMSLAEYEQGKTTTLWTEFYRDFTVLLRGLPIGYRQSKQIPWAQRVAALDRISQYVPDSIEFQDAVIDTMEEEMPYPDILAYCDKRIEEGHDYYRCLKVYMRVDYQLEMIEQALMAKYGKQYEPWEIWHDFYDPSLVPHDQIDLAFKEAWADPTSDPKHLYAYCKALLQADEVTRDRTEDVAKYIDYALVTLAKVPEDEQPTQLMGDMRLLRAYLDGQRDFEIGPFSGDHASGVRTLKRREREQAASEGVTPVASTTATDRPDSRETGPEPESFEAEAGSAQ